MRPLARSLLLPLSHVCARAGRHPPLALFARFFEFVRARTQARTHTSAHTYMQLRATQHDRSRPANCCSKSGRKDVTGGAKLAAMSSLARQHNWGPWPAGACLSAMSPVHGNCTQNTGARLETSSAERHRNQSHQRERTGMFAANIGRIFSHEGERASERASERTKGHRNDGKLELELGFKFRFR